MCDNSGHKKLTGVYQELTNRTAQEQLVMTAIMADIEEVEDIEGYVLATVLTCGHVLVTSAYNGPQTIALLADAMHTMNYAMHPDLKENDQ